MIERMRYRKKFVICILLVTMLVTMLPMHQLVAKANQTVIRVGYDENSTFIQEENGNFYGYGVEYLDKISEYTGWKYEYVKNESWQGCIEMLRNGEIDMLCTAHYTEERAKEFIYADIPLGYEASLLYASKDSEISYQNFEAMNGTKIGLLMESYSAQAFAEYAIEQNIQYEGVYYSEEDEMLGALNDNEVDMIVLASRYATPKLKLVDTSDSDAFYCISNQNNQMLIDEIEAVLQQIMFDNPTFEGSLMSRYYSYASISSTPPFTKEELEYIESLGTIKIVVIQNQKPSCYIENGVTKGIWPEVIKLLSEKSGIDFQLEVFSPDQYTQDTYKEYLEQGYLLLRTQRAMEYASDIEGTIVSNPITNVSVSYVKRQAAFVEDKYVSHIIATTKDLAYLEHLLLEENPDYEIKYYEDTKSCLEALLNKQAGVVIQNSHRVTYLMQKPEYADKLAIVPGVEHGNDVRISAMEERQMLIDIINKTIRTISNTDINEIVKRELLMSPYVMDTDDFFYLYWNWIILVVVLVIVGLGVYTVMTHRVARLRVQKKEYEILQKKVQLDEITGLYNRGYFYQLAKEVIENSNEKMCIITMDITNFKIINEIYGMNAGDKLLKEVAEYLRKVGDGHEMISARFMADHYYMCMPKSEFDKIEFPKSFQTFLEGMDIKVVYGVFIVEDNDIPINVMCDRAFLAVHDKKYTYMEYVHFYNEFEHKQILKENEIENEMEKSLNGNEFYIVIQPKYNASTESIVGGESLVRWQHREKGIISPGVFIPIFEKNGFIIQLDYFVWEETCKEIAKMKSQGLPTVPISVNVSRAHFYGSELINRLLDLVERYQLSTGDLELEITESICGEDSDSVYDKIRELQSRGFRIAMDDFGSGYSSLNMLKEMPLDIIKMDLKFLDGNQEKGQKILKALIDMAHTLDLGVVVEGVEILSQVEFLRQYKDCSLQGYYFSRPVVSDVFEEMISKNI